MTGKTHLSVGTAAAVCVTQPQNLSSLLLCLGTAAIGSVISDIDVTTLVYGIFPDITPYFSAAMLSHMLIDMLNYKNVRILYPLKFGISLDLCHADGLVSKALFHAGMAVLTIMVLFLLYRMYFH